MSPETGLRYSAQGVAAGNGRACRKRTVAAALSFRTHSSLAVTAGVRSETSMQQNSFLSCSTFSALLGCAAIGCALDTP
ncbi:MAG: hypothetical protein ACREPT_08865, partial [Rudaea sp.]